MRKPTRIWQQSMAYFRTLEATGRLVACVEAVSYVLFRRRTLSTIAICSMVWLASLWLAAAIALAQESPSNESGITVTQPAPPSAAAADTRHLVIGMVDRSELEPGALQSPAVQVANPRSTDQRSAEKVLIPVDSRDTEYASLAALASAPPSSLLNAAQRKSSGRAHSGSSASGTKPLVYRLGAVNLVVNGLPDSFSVPSAGNGIAGSR